MKLEDVKQQIDDFFDNITAEELYEISVLKYGFSEIVVELEGNAFTTGRISYYSPTNKSIFENKNSEENFNIGLSA